MKAINLLDKSKSSLRKLGGVVAMLFALLQNTNAQVYVTDGAKINFQGGSTIHTSGVNISDNSQIGGKGTIILTQGDWVNNNPTDAVFSETDSVDLVLQGSSQQMLGGASSTNFSRVVMNNANGAYLSNNQTVRDAIQFQNGILQLEGWTVYLGSTGYLDGESETSHAFDPYDGGVIVAERVLNQPNNADPANMGINISSNETLDTVKIIRGHTSRLVVSDTSMFLFFVLIPDNTPTNPIDIKVKYFDARRHPSSITSSNPLDMRTKTDGFWQPRFAQTDIPNKTVSSNINNFSGDTITLAGKISAPLPVTLVSIQASCLDGITPVVERVTSSELNNSHYRIQKSVDGVNWLNALRVEGAGTTSQERKYNFFDLNHTTGGKVYYRLQQVDFDGKSEFSSVVTADCAIDSIHINIYPNPTTGWIIVDYTSPVDVQVPLEIYDMLGKRIKSQTLSIMYGTNKHYIDLSELPAAMYNIKVGNINEKIVKQH